MAIERTDYTHAAGVFNVDVAGNALVVVAQDGFRAVVRDGVGRYRLQCNELIGYRESICLPVLGLNQAGSIGAQIIEPGVVLVNTYDALNDPADVVQFAIEIKQVASVASPDGIEPPLPTPITPGGGVTSVFGRTGVVVAVAGDYEASEVANDSGVSGATVADALDALDANIPAGAQIIPFTTAGVSPFTVPTNMAVHGAWMAPGGGGGGGGGSGGSAFTNAGAGGGGGGGSGGQGGGGSALEWVPLSIGPGVELSIDVGLGGVGGVGGANVLALADGLPGSPGSAGGDSVITATTGPTELARASASAMTVPQGGRGGFGGLQGAVGAGGLGGTAPSASGGGWWPYFRNKTGAYALAGAPGGAPGVAGTNTPATATVINPGLVAPANPISSQSGGTGGAQSGGTHGGGGAGSPGGSGGLGWESQTQGGTIPAQTVGRGTVGIGTNGVDGGNTGGASGPAAPQATGGRGGGGGAGGGGGGHSAAAGGRSNDGGNGCDGSEGAIFLVLVPV